MIETTTQDRLHDIRQLNDNLRTRGEGGRTVLSQRLAALPSDDLVLALRAVAAFSAFDERNDPHGEHDCAIVEAAGHQLLWKIDYYDPDFSHHSQNPANAGETQRVLTIMLAEEY
jgi:CRISPR/Cas system Type II protein with McrA/HNH and RuvC-like nuclease domain